MFIWQFYPKSLNLRFALFSSFLPHEAKNIRNEIAVFQKLSTKNIRSINANHQEAANVLPLKTGHERFITEIFPFVSVPELTYSMDISKRAFPAWTYPGLMADAFQMTVHLRKQILANTNRSSCIWFANLDAQENCNVTGNQSPFAKTTIQT